MFIKKPMSEEELYYELGRVAPDVSFGATPKTIFAKAINDGGEMCEAWESLAEGDYNDFLNDWALCLVLRDMACDLLDSFPENESKAQQLRDAISFLESEYQITKRWRAIFLN